MEVRGKEEGGRRKEGKCFKEVLCKSAIKLSTK